jgi:hypothetical protein
VFVNSTQLTATINAADVDTAGSENVTVFNTAAAELSNSVAFTVNTVGGFSFTDDFERADNAAIGNNWVEKTPATFSIMSGAIAKVAAGDSYHNNIVYRPAGEALGDCEAILEFIVPSAAAVGYPQVIARAQTDTIADADALDAYLLFLNNSASEIIIRRQTGTGSGTNIATGAVSPTIQNGNQYRFRLRVTNPDASTVRVEGWVEEYVTDAWVQRANISSDDTDAARHSADGTFGFSGFTEAGQYTYQLFSVSEV